MKHTNYINNNYYDNNIFHDNVKILHLFFLFKRELFTIKSR